MHKNLLEISEELRINSFTIMVKFDYEIVAKKLGMEATASLVNAFYDSLVENLSATLKHKCPTEPFSLHKDNGNEQVKFSNSNKSFHDFTIELLNSINENTNDIVIQIVEEDLLIEDEQKIFFDRMISYEVIHALLRQQNQYNPIINYNHETKTKI